MLPDIGPVIIAPPIAAPVESRSNAAVSPRRAIATARVLHVINGQHYAGAERVQDLLAKCLPQEGFEVGFACVKLDLFDEIRETRDAALYDTPMWSRFDVRAAWKVADIVRRDGYQILHGHTVRTAMIAAVAARWTGVPLVYHSHSPALRDTTHRWRNRINSIVERLSLRRAAQIIAVSRSLADDLVLAGFDPEWITVVYNGVPSPRMPIERRLPTGTWTLGAAALFRPRKGLEVLLEAMAILRQRGVPIHLRAVGSFESDDYRAEIVRRVRQLGLCEHISWPGFTRDVTAEMLKMDLFVLPSLFGEGLPMVVLEAMAAGVPVVASAVGGVSEAVRNGREGLLVTPGNAGELAEAIAQIIHGEVAWPALRTHALARHAQMFSDRAMASGVAEVYRNVLDR